jgi:hypothetical protein
MALADTIGGKTAGELIRSNDWNTLVDAVDALTESVATQFAQVNARVDTLQTQVDTLEDTLTTFQTQITTLLGQYNRVTLETTRETYAIGEQAEIVARVTDLFGNPLALDNNTRPWVDFVSTWGQFKTVSGFETRTGAGEHAISVRTNLQGVARVRVRADHVDEDDDDDELVVSGVLNSNVAVAAASQPMFQLFAQSSAPVEAQAAYQILTTQYDASPAFQHYVDKYYVGRKPFTPGFARGQWIDYRSTVMAFVKNDSNALTPDAGRGFSSIQITFRDWISSWLDLDYLDIVDDNVFVVDLGNQFGNIFAGDLAFAYQNAKDLVNSKIRDNGVLARERDYRVVEKALGRVNPPDPEFGTAVDNVKNGVTVQKNFEAGQKTLEFTSQTVAFNAFTNVAAESTKAFSTLSGELGTLQQNIDQTSQAVADIGSQVQVHTGTLNTLFAENGAISILQRDVDNVKGNVARFLDFNPTEITQKAELLQQANVQLMDKVFQAINKG